MEYYDVSELWDSFLEPVAFFNQDGLMCAKDEEWGSALYLRDGVVLRDRLMTDAALGGPRPIKSEHSYSLLAPSPPPSPATPGDNPHTPNPSSGAVGSTVANTSSCIGFTNLGHKTSLDIRSRLDDMEEECFPTIPISSASNRIESSSSPLTSSSTSTLILKKDLVPEDNECPEIKGEPISAPASPCTPCQPNCDMVDDKNTITIVPPESLFTKAHLSHMSDSEDDDEEYYQNMEVEEYNVLCEEEEEAILHTSRQGLPPTPPSSASSDSEGTASASCSPERRDSQTSTQNLRGFVASRFYHVTNTTGTHTTRQPINTPLISCQPKGSTGELTLTEEEKRTLQAEGYPVPTKLPLTKQEEKCLKKVRRKIKNKISAQESRRKKKEYMDNLERRVNILVNENASYRERLNILEEKNRELVKEVQRLQTILHS